MTVSTATSHPGAMPVAGASEGFSPARMMDVELTEPLPTVSYDGRHRRVWVLGRLHTEPVGVCVVDLGQEGLTPGQFGALLWPEFREPVMERFAAAGLPPPRPLTGYGLEADAAAWPFLRRRLAVWPRHLSSASLSAPATGRSGCRPGCAASVGRNIRGSRSWWWTTRPPAMPFGLSSAPRRAAG